MSVLVYGIKGTVDEKEIFNILKKAPIPSFNLPSFPPALPPLPIPKLPELKKPEFKLNFNPPKYNNGADLSGKKLTVPKLPSVGFNLPSFPPALPPLPIPKLPSLALPSFDLKLNPPKYNTNFGGKVSAPTKSLPGGSFTGISLLKPKLPSVGFNLPSFPPALPPLPIPQLPKAPVVDFSGFKSYFNMKLPYLNIKVPEVQITPITKVE